MNRSTQLHWSRGGCRPLRACVTAGMILVVSTSFAEDAKTVDAAAAFGARPSVSDVSLSPDGSSIAFVKPAAGQGAELHIVDLAHSNKTSIALIASGKPERLAGCHWVSNDRLACKIYGLVSNAAGILPVSRLIAVDRDGGNFKVLSNESNYYTRGYLLASGSVIDWLPDENGAVLMSRAYLPDDHTGSRIGSTRKGLGVDWLDTRTLHTKQIETPGESVRGFISDGRGTVRIMETELKAASAASGMFRFLYRKSDSREWQSLNEYNSIEGRGFFPTAVDRDLDVAYGFKKKDGRFAFYSVALDGSLAEKLIFASQEVDADGLVRIGRRNRVVGVSYATDVRHRIYFDANIDQLMKALSRALPRQPLVSIVDTSVEENVMVVFAGSDDDSGMYYLFDRASKQLHPLLQARDELEGVQLAKVKSITYPAADGTIIPGYLTLPPGAEDAKGLPAIVLPHGGPAARDEWGFDWLSQFFAARGFAVIRPEFRGSAGYGDAWLQQNGFKSWRVAIGDVIDAGRWLVSQGIADPAKLCVVGWSYGGYAALQAAVVEPNFFKAVVAIAPVTDLQAAKEEWRGWSNFKLMSDYIGEGPHITEGSPARNAEKIKVPVLLFHGALDRNVGITQSRLLDARLAKTGVMHELVTWEDLDHYLDDSSARTLMLRKADAFLRKAIGEQ
jgi:dienelactone hydrolase